MTRPRKPWLDWKPERRSTEAIISRNGGVLRVVASENGPLMEFASVLRSLLEHGQWTPPWITTQFDPENSHTRYFPEMTRQLERTLSLPPQSAPPVELGEGTKIGSDLQGGPIWISNSFNFGSDDYYNTIADEQRAERIIRRLNERMGHESHCFLFVNSESFLRRDLHAFRELIWERMAKRDSGGSLLVDLTRSPRTDTDWPPEPSESITLDDYYDGAAREHAISDLASYLFESGVEPTLEEARAYSRGMLDNHKGAATLYAQLAAITTRMA